MGHNDVIISWPQFQAAKVWQLRQGKFRTHAAAGYNPHNKTQRNSGNDLNQKSHIRIPDSALITINGWGNFF